VGGDSVPPPAETKEETTSPVAAAEAVDDDSPAKTKEIVQKVVDRKEQPASASATKTTLTPITASRLMERIALMSTLREMVGDGDWDWSVRDLRGLPQCWEPLKHDKTLIKGILKHGAGQWPLIAQDKELDFPLKERRQEEEGKEVEDTFPDQRICVKRCKQIQGSYQRHRKRLQNPLLQQSTKTKEKRPSASRKGPRKAPNTVKVKKEEEEESISAANDLLKIQSNLQDFAQQELKDEPQESEPSTEVEAPGEQVQEQVQVQVRRSKRKR
jgi:hypothetical protein